ncbi:hypothetical protein [Winogradskyella sp. PE311]|uniref:hypothetical protein n=1 Tax=Winogradskyella sp. PE311 TaxID=3366943 RepID=UPI00397FC6FE
MKFLTLALLVGLLNINSLASQEKLVPIRQNERFGLSTLNKEVKVKPVYDKINFGNSPNYFVAFKKDDGNTFKSSLFHLDKVILKDKPYFDYGIYDDVIIAADTTTKKTVKYHNSFYNEKMHLYTKDGVLLTEEYYAFISVFEEASKIKPTSELILFFRDLDDKYSIKIYDTKKKKLVRTLLDKTDEIDFVSDDQLSWALESMRLTYTKEDVFGSMEVKLLDRQFKIISDQKSTIDKKPKKRNYYLDDENIEVPNELEKPIKSRSIPKYDSISKSLKEAGIVKNHKNFIETDYLYFEANWYNKNNYDLGYKNGKVGLIDTKKGEYILPTIYDNIYKVNYFLAFVIEKDNKYGLFFPYTNEIIKPIFDDFPVVVRKTSRNLGYDLIALFDVKTQKLKYYATFDGIKFLVE